MCGVYDEEHVFIIFVDMKYRIPVELYTISLPKLAVEAELFEKTQSDNNGTFAEFTKIAPPFFLLKFKIFIKNDQNLLLQNN
jgi:hypothetical protein